MIIPNIWENTKCSKPPIRYSLCTGCFPYLESSEAIWIYSSCIELNWLVVSTNPEKYELKSLGRMIIPNWMEKMFQRTNQSRCSRLLSGNSPEKCGLNMTTHRKWDCSMGFFDGILRIVCPLSVPCEHHKSISKNGTLKPRRQGVSAKQETWESREVW